MLGDAGLTMIEMLRMYKILHTAQTACDALARLFPLKLPNCTAVFRRS